jgi:hypothetical protein
MQKNSLELFTIQQYLRRRSSTLDMITQRRRSLEHMAAERRNSVDEQAIAEEIVEENTVTDNFEEIDVIATQWQESLVRTLNALDNGVRLGRRTSTEHNVKLQGDVSMLGASQFKARMSLKESIAFQTVLENWWDQLELNADSRLDIEQYTEINIALHHLMQPGISDEEATSTAAADYELDIKRYGAKSMGSCGADSTATGMGFETFFESMFELCDTWCNTCVEEDYINLVMQMQTAHVEHQAQKARKKSDRAKNLWKQSIGHVRIALRWQANVHKRNKRSVARSGNKTQRKQRVPPSNER